MSAGGLSALDTGSGEYAGGLSALDTGSGEYAGGLIALDPGSGEYAGGLSALDTGSGEYAGGLFALDPGSGEYAGGLIALDPGSGEYAQQESAEQQRRLRESSDREMNAGGAEAKETRGGERRRLPRLKIPGKLRKIYTRKNHAADEQQEEPLEVQWKEQEQLEETSRKLIIREEQLFSQDSPSEEEEDQLQKELEALQLQILMAIQNTFTSSSLGELEVLRSAVASIQQQEEQDQRWAGRPAGQAPVWRPQKCLSRHNTLLCNMIEFRLKEAAEDDSGGANQLSSPVKREVCHLGKRVKEDLLMVVRMVKDCYPPQMDILNLYAGLYHQRFSTRLTQLAASGLEADDCSYLLFWVNHCYPHEILKHVELDGKIKTTCLGSLLLQDDLNWLEEQYLTHTEDKVKLWLTTALKKEEESWLSGKTPELIDQYYFSPMAIDVIQVVDGSLADFRQVIRDQSKTERIIAHLENFLNSYKKCMEEFVKGKHGNVRSVMKAHLVCEEQLREYITGTVVSDQQKCCCLDTLSALKDCGYRCLICPSHLKVCCSQLWTSGWLDGSISVVNSLLDSLNQHLSDLTDLKPACRQAVLCVLHQDVALQYVKRMMKTRRMSREQQLGGAQRLIEDTRRINDFFAERGCSDSSWISSLLCSIAEILRLQDSGSVQLEMVCLTRMFPDLSDTHVLALLSLKTGLSAADIRSIRRSVEENHLHDASSNHSPPFFSMVKVKWINSKINQMGLQT
ncbi:hypothetical protein PAMA_007367 [Pampus argenteus]